MKCTFLINIGRYISIISEIKFDKLLKLIRPMSAEAVDQTSATNPQNPQISQDTENVAEGGDEGKLKTLTNILKKCVCHMSSGGVG